MTAANRAPSADMVGAIDPIVARGRARIKSASIEASGNQATLVKPQAQSYPFAGLDDSSIPPSPTKSEGKNEPLQRNSNSFHRKARKLLTFSPNSSSSSSLKPSISTSCLLTTEDSLGNSKALVCVPTRASLTHQWKKLKTPNKCRECNLLVYFNGRECSFCGFVAHKKCVTVLVIKCSGQKVTDLNGLNKSNGDKESSRLAGNAANCAGACSANQQQVASRNKGRLATVQPIFGQPIDLDSFKVVDFIRRFIYEIDTRGLASKGIYRVSSIKSKVDRLCNYYDQNLSSLIDLSSFHPNIIANALKMYLRQLPEPLLTDQLYPDFINMAKKYSTLPEPQSQSQSSSKMTNKLLQSCRQRKTYLIPTTSAMTTANTDPSYNPMLIVELREVIDLLPPINKELVAIIMRHLKRVADMSADNQMSARNLSIIFGPTLLTANNKSLAIVDNIHQARVVELMITWANQIFPQYANYESKAVIELNFSEDRSELLDDQRQLDLKEKHLNLGNKLEQEANQSSDINQKKVVNQKHSKSKDKQKTKSDKVGVNHDSKVVSPDMDKMRNDIKELRRQFFTVPQVQANLVTTDLDSSQALKILEPTNDLAKKPIKPFGPPGSVPVIKVQPFFCNMLTKYAKSS